MQAPQLLSHTRPHTMLLSMFPFPLGCHFSQLHIIAVTVLNCCKRQSFCITTFTSTLANWRTKRTAVTRRFQRLNRVIQWFIRCNRKTAFSTDKIFDLLFTMSNLFPMIKLITATCALFPSLPALPASWCWSKIDRAGPQLMINQTFWEVDTHAECCGSNNHTFYTTRLELFHHSVFATLPGIRVINSY